MVRVLRMEPGDRLILMDHEGRRFLASIATVTRREVDAVLERPLPGPHPSPVRITLCQALLRSGPMDYLIQKTSELGVDRIQPFTSLRTIITIREERLSNRLRHWRGIAGSSAKQSGRIVPAVIASPASFRDLIGEWKGKEGVKAILWEGEGTSDLKGLLRGSSRREKFIGIAGPEGGFAGEEVDLAREAGFVPVSLGRRILRSETAGMTMVAIVQYEWGDLGVTETD